MGLAIDLRKNGLKGEVPSTLFANATWCLHIPNATPMEPRGQGQGVAGRLMTAANTVPCSAEGNGRAGDQRDAKDLVVALKGGAAKVRIFCYLEEQLLVQRRLDAARMQCLGQQVAVGAAPGLIVPAASTTSCAAVACSGARGARAVQSCQPGKRQAGAGAGSGAVHCTPQLPGRCCRAVHYSVLCA